MALEFSYRRRMTVSRHIKFLPGVLRSDNFAFFYILWVEKKNSPLRYFKPLKIFLRKACW